MGVCLCLFVCSFMFVFSFFMFVCLRVFLCVRFFVRVCAHTVLQSFPTYVSSYNFCFLIFE